MNDRYLEEIIASIRDGNLSSEEARRQLKEMLFEDLGYAKVDHHRAHRSGFPEVVFGQGKDPAQTAEIALALWNRSGRVLITRADKDQFNEVKKAIPCAELHIPAGIISAQKEAPAEIGSAAVLSAGTADIPVAEEAAVTLEFSGIRAVRFFDVGVAGIHRLFDCLESIRSCQVIIIAAGMDGALPSVAAGVVDRPVIAVPTSVGYGASFSGLSALLTMLNSCAAGVGVVNIDNGFGAAALAHRIISSGRSFL